MKKIKTTYNVENERIKIKYFNYLKHARGLKENTISNVERLLKNYDLFSRDEGYQKFNSKKAEDFKEFLTNAGLSLATQKNILKKQQDFLRWLMTQPGYKRKIDGTSVDFLNMSRGETRIAQSKKIVEYPTLSEVKKVVKSIAPNSEMNRRNRALLAFTLLSGMRINAIISLPLKAFNPETMEIFQYPNLGVHTKFSKSIHSVLMPFDEELLAEVINWVKFLREEKNFTDEDPIFPAMKLGHIGNFKKFVAVSVQQKFLKSINTVYMIFKRSFKNANMKAHSPHKFRHTAIDVALSLCTNGKEIKAVSQNFGHENVQTTMSVYAQLPDKDIISTIQGLFVKANDDEKDAIMDDVVKMLMDYKNKHLKRF